MQRYAGMCVVIAGLFVLGALTAAGATVALEVGDLPVTPLVRHEAVVTVRNAGDTGVRVAVEFAIKPPVEVQRTVRRAVTVAARGSAQCRLPYELFEPGEHKVTCVAKVDAVESARWKGKLTASDPAQVPRLFPDYYRRRLTVGGGREVTTSFGPLTDSAPGTRAVAAQGAGTVRFATDAGARELAVTVVPRPATPEPVVAIDADNRLLAAGKPWFPLGIYTTPATDDRCRELREAGFDLVCLQAMPPAPLRRALDMLGARGLRAWVPVGHELQFAEGDVAAKRKRIEGLVAAVGTHPALAMWESIDEPAWGGSPAWGLREGYQFLRALDPRRPIWTNHAPRNRVDTLVHYNQATDIAGCDIYPVPMPQSQSNLPNKTLSVVGDETRKSVASVGGGKPVLMVLQAFAWKNLSSPGNPRAVYPSFAESRFMAYDAIAGGANGILYWGVYSTPRPSRFWSDLKSLVSELRAMAPVLAAVPLAGQAAARALGDGNAVRVSHRRLGAAQVLVVVNRTAAARLAEVSVPGVAGVTWRPLFGDPSAKVDAGRLRVELPAWGVAVLTSSADFRPERKRFDAELAYARPAQSLPVEPGNAVRNPSFEVDSQGDGTPDAWNVQHPFTSRLDRQVRHTGQSSLCLESTEAGFRPLAVQHACKTEGNRRYRLSGWLRSDTPGVKARIYAEWVADGRFNGHVLPWTATTAEWKQVELEFATTPDPKGGLYVVVQVDGPGRAWFDDIRLTLLP
jgi:hypothetical protein